MCGREGLGREGKYYIDGRFGTVLGRLEVAQRFNVPPSAKVPLLRVVDGEPDASLATWGLKPSWHTKGPTPSNARGESVQKSGMFRSAFQKRRGVIPIDHLYEWAKIGDHPKQPNLIRRADGEPLWIASLWEFGDELPSATMVTTTPNDFMAEIHDRMPVILEPEEVDRWIDATPEEAATMIAPAPHGILERHPGISRREQRSIRRPDLPCPNCLALRRTKAPHNRSCMRPLSPNVQRLDLVDYHRVRIVSHQNASALAELCRPDDTM